MLPGFPRPTKEEQIKVLEELGESEIRYILATSVSNHRDFDRAVAEEWLRQREQSRQVEREAKMLKMAESARADARSARIAAIIAATIAAASTIISAIIKVNS